MNSSHGKKFTGLRFVMATAAVFIIIAGLKEASHVFIPFMFALFLSILAGPVVIWLKSKKVPTAISVFLVTLITATAIIGIAALLTKSADSFTTSFPAYRENMSAITTSIDTWLVEQGVETGYKAILGTLDLNSFFDMMGRTLKGVISTLSSTMLMLIIMVFVMLEAAEFQKKIKAAFGDSVDMDRFASVSIDVQKYLAIKTFTSALTGIIVWAWVSIMGFEFAVLWGLIAFFLNYIPFIGSIIASIPAILLAIATSGFLSAGILGAGYFIINTGISNLLEPMLMGRRLGLSPLIVFLSLVFWGYVWGPAGMLISVPLTMLVKILLEHSVDFSWVAVLMGRTPES